MSRLSPALKSLIALPSALGAPIPAPPLSRLTPVLDKLRQRAEQGGAARQAWLAVGTAASVTVNSPQTLCRVYDYAANGDKGKEGAEVAAGMREVALKCISFNGVSVPRFLGYGMDGMACADEACWSICPTTRTVYQAHEAL